MISGAGRLSHPSPNFGPRRNGALPWLVILHYTAMESAAAALERLCDPEAQVSAHYLITAEGEVCSLVREAERAWHAGAGCWRGCNDINSASIGIELDNDGTRPFALPQMAALERLLPDVMARWKIRPEGVIGHQDMAPARKHDPGGHFDWTRLAARGLAARPDVVPVEALFSHAALDAEIEDLLTKVGYTGGEELGIKLAAFRQRFLPQCFGPPNEADRLVLLQYLNDYPVDRSVATA